MSNILKDGTLMEIFKNTFEMIEISSVFNNIPERSNREFLRYCWNILSYEVGGGG